MGRWGGAGLAWLVLAVHLFPAAALAQSTKAGIVTTLEGHVTAVRSVSPQPVALKFKDDVYLHDRVVTGDQSFARLLLGGKAVISIRERSAVTITEIPGRSIVDIESGKIALSVARDRMVPGEVINIKTPNAVAGVRGTVVVAQVTYSLGPGGAREPTSNLWVIRGLVEAVHTNAQGAPLGAPVTLNPQQSFNATPTTATMGTFTVEQIGTIVQGLQPQRTQDGGSASQGPARLEAVNTATALLNALVSTTEGEKQIALLTGPPPQIATPDTEPKQEVTSAADVALSPLIPFVPPPQSEPPKAGTFTLPHVFSGPAPETPPGTGPSGTGPVGSFTDLVLTQAQGSDLIRVAPDADVTLMGPLLALTNSSITAGDSFLSVAGQMSSSSPAPLISLDPTMMTAPGNIVEIVGPSGVLKLVGPLLKDVGGTITAGAGIVAVSGGGRLTGTASDGATPEPLVQLIGTTASAGTVLSVTGQGSSAELTGSLLSTQGGSLALSGLALADVSQGGRVSSTSTLPFVNLVGTALALPETTFVVSGGQLNVGGSLLRAESAPIVAGLGLFVDQKGSVTVGGPVFDLINTTVGVPPELASSVTPVFKLAGGALSAPTAEGHLFRVDVCIAGDAPLVDARNGASVRVQGANGNVLRLDTALLDATAPVIALLGAATRLETSGSAVDLVDRASLQSTDARDALIRIDSQARMDVLNGHLVSVSASRLSVAGDLVRMGNNTTLNVPRGVLLSLSNGAIVSLGSLVRFTGEGATLSVANGLVPTRFDGGIPIHVAAGALANISIDQSGAISGLAGNTLNVAKGSSLVSFTGTGGTLKIGN
jgi:FecR protein